MQLINVVLAVLISCLAVVSAAPLQERVEFYLQNNCPFEVYVCEAVAEHPSTRPSDKCADFGESQEVILSGHGNTFFGLFEIYNDSCGHNVKAARQPGGPVYQSEFKWALENNKVWYNLSHEDGNPFTDIERQLGMSNGCTVVKCDTGIDGSRCGYGVQTDCPTLGAIFDFLCDDLANAPLQ